MMKDVPLGFAICVGMLIMGIILPLWGLWRMGNTKESE